MKIGNLYFHIRLHKIGFTRVSKDMWQIRLGFLTISRMYDGWDVENVNKAVVK